MQIIGITGTIGAGKGTVVEYLSKNKDFEHYSVRDFLKKILKQRKVDINRDTMISLANELRNQNNPSYIVEKLAEEAVYNNKDCIIESIRTIGEADTIKTFPNSILLAVDAGIENRYERIKKRNSETDQVDFETFIANEKREMYSDDPNKQNLLKCIEMADYKINNDGSPETLYEKIEAFFDYFNAGKE